jgi:SAM-dependent methyltransferase
MTKPFQDHFSGHADAYRLARPTYPKALFELLHQRARANASGGQALRVWDVGCGNGQASLGLAQYFDEVLATDASAEQIARAMPHTKVQYACSRAEDSGFAGGSVDLVFVGQALHWFQFEAFFAEVRRVCKPGAPIVAVLYELSNISPDIDAVFRAFYRGAIGPFWPGDRAHIDTRYASVPWPFAPLAFPTLDMQVHWSLEQMLAYVGTWSGVQRYLAAGNPDQLPALREQLAPLWGEGPRLVSWPLHHRAGVV